MPFLNLFVKRNRDNVPIWQYPPFLFFVLGLVNIVSMISAYFIGRNVLPEDTLVIVVVMIAIILLIISHVISRSFERLIELNRMKTEFIKIISHQLRTPLSAIKWSLSILGKEANDENERAQYLSIVKDNNERMILLINDLLVVARLEHGQLKMKPEKISLKNILQEIIQEYSAYARSSNVVIQLADESKSGDVWADSEYLKIAAKHLMDNAIRYIDKSGEVKIKIFNNDKKVVCSIKDNGVGIPVSEQKQIFQKFFRAQNILRHQTEGTGLGLYIAKTIVNLLGGELGFNSQEGKGSTFYFSLPIKNN